MERSRLGGSELETAPLVLGGNVFGWTADENASLRILDTFLDAGFNAVDTADIYSNWAPKHQGGESEEILGRWFKARGNRSQTVLVTKLGMATGKASLSRRHMAEAVDASLRRLQTDYIDLYLAHVDDLDTPLEETLEGFAALIEAGKVRTIGASNHTGARLKAALDTSRRLGLPRYEVVQPRYNLMDRATYEADLEPVVQAEGLGVIPYYGLAAGFLTGKYRAEADLAKSPRGGVVKAYLNERGRRVLEALDDVAAAHGATPAQAALAWLMASPSVSAPIASATTAEQFHEIAGAAYLQLRPEDVSRLDQASAEG